MRRPYTIDALFDIVQTRFGHVDILINDAGISPVPTAVENTSVEMSPKIIDIDLNSVFLCTRACR